MNRYYLLVIQAMNGAGVVWIFALMFIICADISGRTLFDKPIPGVPELVSMSLVGCLFLQLAYTVHAQRLTRTEIISHYLNKQHPLLAVDWDIFLSVIACLVLSMIFIGTWPDFWRALQTREFAGVEGIYTIPVWPVKLFVFAGSLIAAIECLRQLFRHASNALHGREALKRALFTLLPVLLGSLIVLLFKFDTSDQNTGIAMIGLVLFLIMMGMPIAIALLLAGFLGIGILKEDFSIATKALSLTAQGTISEYVFATVPLFVLMGMFVSISEIGRDSFRAAQQLFGRLKGGLGIATVAANAVFAAITGISIASAAIFTKIAVPALIQQGYTARFAVGLTAGSSVLGMLIPPSLLLIIYGVIAEVSIGGLFLAAIIPGLLLALAFSLGIFTMAQYWPEFVGEIDTRKNEQNNRPQGNLLFAVLPVLILIVLVLGGIYGGIFTPTEAGAAGAFAAMCIAWLKRKLSWKNLWEVIRETGQVSVTILFLIIAASAFSRMLTLTGLPQDIAAYLTAAGLGLAGFLAAYLVLLIILGTVLDSTSILLILLPLVLPVVSELGGNLIWFGIVTVIGVEIGLMTPPLGLSVYVIKSSLDDDSISLGTIFAGAFPFVLITLAVTILLMMYPALSLVLVH